MMSEKQKWNEAAADGACVVAAVVVAVLVLLTLTGCAELDSAGTQLRETREAVADRVDAAIVDKVCRMPRVRLLELVSGDAELADAIEARCTADSEALP